MDFEELLDHAVAMLQRRGRVAYRTLKMQFELSEDGLEALKDELIYAQQVARDEEDRVLVWTGDAESAQSPTSPQPTPEPATPLTTAPDREPLSYTPPHLAEKILTSRSALEGERKQVTVLFCDLRNSTAIAEQIGAEAMHGLLSRFFELAMDEVHRYEGTVNQLLGDGCMALFGAPIAHEDHARRAVFAALDLQRTLRGHHEELGGQYGVELAFRIRLNTGMVVVGSVGSDLRLDYTAIGDTTNLAARLEQVAEPGTILVSETTSRFVQGYVRLEALAPVEVKGKTEPVSIYKVLGTLPRRSPIASRSERTLSHFVGRERELATLEELFTQVETGSGQVIGIVAEAGQGKSRLLYEFRRRLRDKRVTYLEGRCLSYGQTIPYHPIIDVLRTNCGITETDSPEAILERVRVALQEVGMDAEESAPYLLQLLGVKEGTESIAQLTPEAVRTRTFETLRQMSLQGSQQRPLIVEIEDLHWIDNTSQDYLALFVESLAGAPILLLTTYRPGYRPPWLDQSYATQISLHHLTPHDGLAVVHSVIQGETLPAQVAQMIIEKAEGNPFFLEELTRAVAESGPQQADVVVPDTVQGVLSARIDRLPDVHKRLLQTASVLGREFAPAVLNAIWEGADALEPLLMELKRLEFLYERTSADIPTYVFKHNLTQEVTYESLLTTRRQALHAATGQALERLYHASLTERSEELAHHFLLGEVLENAFDYLAKSGDKARQAYANQEAIAFYTHAIEVRERITPTLDAAQLLPVYEGRGLVWMLLHKLDEAIGDFQTMRQMARASGNQQKEGESLCHLAYVHHQAFSEALLPLAEQYAQEALQLAHQTGDPKALAMSLAVLGALDQTHGNLPEADRKLEESLRISRREGDKGSWSLCLGLLGLQAYWQGHWQRAIALSQEGVAVSRDIHSGYHELFTLGHLEFASGGVGNYVRAFHALHEGIQKAKERDNKYHLARMTNTIGWLHFAFGAVFRAIDYDCESVELGRTYGISNAEISALINLGLDYLALDETARALSYLEPTLDRVEREAFGAHRWRWTIRLLIGLAELSYSTADYEQALHYVEEGLKEAQRTSSQKYVALGWALRGKIAAKLGDTDSAGTELQRAFTLAEQLQSPSLIYPIAYDLGQWNEMTGKEREAATLYSKATTTIEQMATAVEDEALRSTFLQSALVQEIHERAARLGG